MLRQVQSATQRASWPWVTLCCWPITPQLILLNTGSCPSEFRWGYSVGYFNTVWYWIPMTVPLGNSLSTWRYSPLHFSNTTAQTTPIQVLWLVTALHNPSFLLVKKKYIWKWYNQGWALKNILKIRGKLLDKIQFSLRDAFFPMARVALNGIDWIIILGCYWHICVVGCQFWPVLCSKILAPIHFLKFKSWPHRFSSPYQFVIVMILGDVFIQETI